MKKTILLLIIIVLGTAVVATGATKKTNSDKKKFNCVAVVNNKCETCHYKSRICAQLGRRNRRKWRTTIKRMVSHGAIMEKDEIEALARCLAASRKNADICR